VDVRQPEQQSLHAAACYGHAVGLRVRLLMTTAPLLDEDERDLLRVQAALGAEQTLLPGGPRLWAALLHAALSRSANAPYLVPPGGSSARGVLGYVNAGLELADQIARGEAPCPDVIYIAAASQGTVLGLAMGLRLAGLNAPDQPQIIAVETTTPGWQAARRYLLRTPERTYRWLRRHSANARRALPERFANLRPCVDRRFEHLPLGVMTSELTDALAFVRNEAGLTLDAHFSAKAFAALRADLAVGRHAGQTVLFWHTHGQAAPELLDRRGKNARPPSPCRPPSRARQLPALHEAQRKAPTKAHTDDDFACSTGGHVPVPISWRALALHAARRRRARPFSGPARPADSRLCRGPVALLSRALRRT
jgi:D-cysteine desulfhydrase